MTSITEEFSKRVSYFWRRFSSWTEDGRCLRALVGVAEAPGTVTRCLDLERKTTEGRKGAKHRNTNFPLSAFDQAVSGGNNVS